MYLLNNIHGLSGQMYHLFPLEEVKISQLIKPETACEMFFFNFAWVCKDIHVHVCVYMCSCVHMWVGMNLHKDIRG